MPAFGTALSPRERLAAARVLARYRTLILLGRLRLPLEDARRLVGPDCAYHLYGRSVPAAPRPAQSSDCPKAERRRRLTVG